tara:strand:+ start:1719 stop:2081 length:363 start_codon:yes stop_codon:yes gene_type:complete
MPKGIRFAGREVRTMNQEDLSENVSNYEKYLEKRDVKRMRYYATPHPMRRPSVQQMASLNLVGYVWKTGDRFYKLADKYYDSPKYWWVIAWFNRAPTEAHLKIGDFITIPTPLEEVLRHI